MAMLKSANVVIKRLFLTILLLGSCQVFASEQKVTGTYSSLEYNRESGDLLGYEVLIIPTDVGYKAIVQVGEGAPGQVYIVDVRKKGANIGFDIPISPALNESFSGHIDGGVLVGDVLSPSGKQHVQLRRGMSYWDK